MGRATRRRSRPAFGVFRWSLRLAARMVRASAVRAVAAVPRPTSPVAEPWELSIATMVRALPGVPSIAAWPLRRLDKFARVAIGPDRVGFDGKTVRWRRVVEVRLYPRRGPVPAVVIDREVARLSDVLPPVPGRKWMVAKAARTVVAANTLFAHPAGATTGPVPCEILYRGIFGRSAHLRAGLFAAMMLNAIPEASHSLITTAQANAIPIRTIPSPPGQTRAARPVPVRPLAGQVLIT